MSLLTSPAPSGWAATRGGGSRSWWTPLTLAEVLASVLVAAWAAAFAVPVSTQSWALAGLALLVPLLYVAAALLGDYFTPQVWVAWALLGCAAAWPMTGSFLASDRDYPWDDPYLALLGILGTAVLQVLVVLILLRCLAERQGVGAYEVLVLVVLVVMSWSRLMLLLHGATAISMVLDLLLAGGCAALATERANRCYGLQRRALVPVLVGAGVAFAAAVFSPYALLLSEPEERAGVHLLQALAVLALPVGVAVSSLRQRLAYGGVVEELALLPWPATVTDVRHALRRALQDERLDILCWEPQRACYVDVEGRPVEEPSSDDLVSVPLRGDGGSPSPS